MNELAGKDKSVLIVDDEPRIGRILVATGRDATDVAISTSFGLSSLTEFFVKTDEFHDAPE